MTKILFTTMFLFLSTASAFDFDYESEECLNIKMATDAIASNIANVETTRTPEGGPYLRLYPYYDQDGNFQIYQYSSSLLEYEPGHPDANEYGLVRYPHINLEKEIESIVEWSLEFKRVCRIE